MLINRKSRKDKATFFLVCLLSIVLSFFILKRNSESLFNILSLKISDFSIQFNQDLINYEIELKPNDFIQFQSQRKLFLTDGKIDFKSYNVNVEQNNNTIESSVSLFATNKETYVDHHFFPIKVNYNGNENFGRKSEILMKFSLDRAYKVFLSNTIFSEVFKYLDIEIIPVNLKLNKSDYGIFFKSSYLDNYFIEKNNFRDSYIVQLSNSKINFIHIPEGIETSQIREFVNNISFDDDFFEIKSIKVIKFLESFFEINLVDWNNLTLYYNPVNNKFIPIIFDLKVSELNGFDLSSFKKDFNFTDLSISEIKYYESILYKNINAVINNINYKKFKESSKTFSNLSNYYEKKINEIKSESESLINSKEIILLMGDIVISEDIVVNSNQKLVFKNFNNIILKNNSSIVVKGGDLEINGFNNSKISISEDSDSFIYVENSNNTRIFNTQFEGFKSLEKYNWILPSAITFYQSKVLIDNSVFKNNTRGDDLINFFRCPSVKVINSKFENILNDAIDSDFSVVEVSNSEFHNIGNDAIDGSGSYVTISYSNFGYVGDKAISAGEKSMFKSIGNKFQNNELGLTIKDGSILSSEFDEFQNNTIDLVMFTKKRIYGKPSVSLNMSNVSSNLIETGIKIENRDFNIRYSKKVEKLLYGEVYGKATK